MTPTAAIVNIFTNTNATMRDAFRFGVAGDTSWSFAGCTFKMEVKAARDDATPLLTMTGANGMIVVDDAVQRVLHFNVSKADLAALPPAEYVYDLVMTDASSVLTVLMAGKLTTEKGVTED